MCEILVGCLTSAQKNSNKSVKKAFETEQIGFFDWFGVEFDYSLLIFDVFGCESSGRKVLIWKSMNIL